jgi:diguanylate cyclase (GGDEF)-like protein
MEYLYALKKVSPIRIIFLNDLLWIVDQQATKPVGKIDFPLWMDERLDFKSLHDTLTDLPNWSLFQDRLRHSLAFAKRNATQCAVMFVELKGLQFATDNMVRNALLKEAAHRLNHLKREIDTLARCNENMFALLLENVSDKAQLDLITDRIGSAMSKPFEIWGQKIDIEPRIHVNICTGICGSDENSKTKNFKQCYECIQTKKMAIASEVKV